MISRILLALIAGASAIGAQTTVVDGTTFDSLSHRALAGAQIQLVGPLGSASPRSYAAISDSSGHFRVDGLPRGQYDAGFFHPALDVAGIELPARHLELQHDHEAVVLATPSGARLAAQLCPDSRVVDSAAILIGHVRDASSELPLAGARVHAEWAATSIDKSGINTSAHTATTETTSSGWFALCGVPSETFLSVRAENSRDSSGVVQMEVGANDVGQMTLYVAHTHGADSVTAVAATSRVRGIVTDQQGKPIAAAHVTVWETKAEATSDGQGSFTIDGVPAGSRTIEVRAIGSEPAVRSVNLLAGQTARVEVAMQRAVVLPTVETRADAAIARALADFEAHKRRAAGGYFFKPTVAQGGDPRMLAHMASDVPGVRVEFVRTTGKGPTAVKEMKYHAYMKRPGLPGYCDPFLFVNGIRSTAEFNDMLDMFMGDDIMAVEIYPHYDEVPSEYRIQTLDSCGVIAVWTRLNIKPSSP